MSQPQIRVRLDTEDFDVSGVEVYKLTGRESVGRLFSFDAWVVKQDGSPLDLPKVVGARVTLRFEREQRKGGERRDASRNISGTVTEVRDQLSGSDNHRHYQLRIRPRAWQMSQVETQDVFLGMSNPDIIRQKLEQIMLAEGTDFAMHLDGDYSSTDGAPIPGPKFTVQYRESDLAFVSRLSEHEGITFFFENQGNDDVMVFVDSPSGFHREHVNVPYSARGEQRYIFELERRYKVIPNAYFVQDYNYRTPHLDVITGTCELNPDTGADSELIGAHAGGIAEYAPGFRTPDEAERMARVRAEEREATRIVYRGKSDVITMAAGQHIWVEDHPDLEDDEAKLIVTEVEHTWSRAIGTSGGEAELEYGNRFRAVPAIKTTGDGKIITFRPARRTEKPRIHGLVTAVVQSELDGAVEMLQKIDAEGRYVIRFHFDPAPTATHRVRMAQPHAGPHYGMHFPLKPGIEVVVAFLDGDPDRPIIVGAVPHLLTKTPVTSTNHELNRIKTRSGVVIEIGDGDSIT